MFCSSKVILTQILKRSLRTLIPTVLRVELKGFFQFVEQVARRERLDQRGWSRDQLFARAARHHRIRSGGSRERRPRGNGGHRRAFRRPRPDLVPDLHPEAASVLRPTALSTSSRAAGHHRHVQDEENGFAERRL